jgi:hypothetical protein
VQKAELDQAYRNASIPAKAKVKPIDIILVFGGQTKTRYLLSKHTI